MKISFPVDAAEQLRLNNYCYIPNTTSAIYRVGNSDYYFDMEKNKLGEGAFGSVYLAYKCDLNSRSIDLTHKVAIKTIRARYIIKDRSLTETVITYGLKLPVRSEIQNEINFLRQYGEQTSNLVEAFEPNQTPAFLQQPHEEKLNELPFYFFAMPYHDGKPLAEFTNKRAMKLNEALSLQNFTQRTTLALQAAMYLSLYHNNTPQTGSMIIHKDLKPANILLCKRERNSKTEYYLWIGDYGVATEISDQIKDNVELGTFISSAPELIDSNQASTRSDVFSFGMLCILIYNGVNPYSIRAQEYLAGKTSHQASFEGFLENLILPGPFHKLLKVLLTAFIKSTLMENIDERATTDECLLFFTLLNKYNSLAKHATDKNPPNFTEYAIIITKLVLIVEKLWDKTSAVLPALYSDDITTSHNKWRNFNFDENPEFCVAAAVIATRDKITDERLTNIFDKLKINERKKAINEAIVERKISYNEINHILTPGASDLYIKYLST
jgi:serine/threonine protein kinase